MGGRSESELTSAFFASQVVDYSPSLFRPSYETKHTENVRGVSLAGFFVGSWQGKSEDVLEMHKAGGGEEG